MTSDRLNWFLTVAANVGVVVGLVFLALEIRHNTLATQATLHLELVAYGRENAELLLSDDVLADVVARGEVDPASLSPAEQEKFLLFASWRMAVWETAFLNNDSGVVDHRYWNGFDSWYTEMTRGKPGYEFWWAESRHGFDARFQEHVDALLGPGR